MARTIEKRLQTARSMDPDYWILDTEPTVIRIESESTDQEYTVVPNVAYCSCDDRQYRQIPCKHLLFLATQAHEDVQEAILDGIEYETSRLGEEIVEIEDRLDTLRDRHGPWSDAFTGLFSGEWTAHGDISNVTTEPTGSSYVAQRSLLKGGERVSKGTKRNRTDDTITRIAGSVK